MRGEKDHGNIRGFAQGAGGLDAGEFAADVNVHQHQIDFLGAREAQGGVPIIHHPGDFVAELDQPFFEIERHQAFVFDDEHTQRRGGKF